MKIAIDGRELAGKATGVGRYLLEILRAWSTPDFPHKLLVILPASPEPAIVESLPGVAWHLERARSAGTRWEQGRLPRALALAQPDVFFAPAYTAPLRLPCPMVVVIHDVSYFAHPEWFGRREGWRRRWLTKATARHARSVLTVSEFSRSEIEKYLRLPPDRLVVARNGAPRVGLKPHLRTGEPLLLYVGSLFNRRRIVELIQGFAAAAPRVTGSRLVLVGDNRTMPRIDPRAVAEAAGVGGQVQWLEYVSDEQRDELYASARAFAFLSDYEGFGLPPMEAMAHGVPSVVLDTAVSREIYGDAAIRVSLDPSAISSAIVALLSDDALHARLTAAGAERLRAFSWVDTAATVRRVLEKAAE